MNACLSANQPTQTPHSPETAIGTAGTGGSGSRLYACLNGFGSRNAIGQRGNHTGMLALRYLAYGVNPGTAGLRRLHVSGNKPLPATLQTQGSGKLHTRLPAVKHHDHVIDLAVDGARVHINRIRTLRNSVWRDLAYKLFLGTQAARI